MMEYREVHMWTCNICGCRQDLGQSKCWGCGAVRGSINVQFEDTKGGNQMNPTSRLIEDSIKPAPIPPEPEGLKLAKPTLIKLLEFAIQERMGLKSVKVLGIGGMSPVTGVMVVDVEFEEVEK